MVHFIMYKIRNKGRVPKSGVRLFPYYLLAYIMPPLYKP